MIVEQEPRGEGTDLDLEIGPFKSGPEIGYRRAAAATVADRHLRLAKAFLLRAVVILCRRVAGREAGFGERLDERILEARALGRQQAVAAAVGTGAVFPALLPFEIGQHMRIGPGGQPQIGPAVVIGAVAADIDHCIDG